MTEEGLGLLLKPVTEGGLGYGRRIARLFWIPCDAGYRSGDYRIAVETKFITGTNIVKKKYVYFIGDERFGSMRDLESTSWRVQGTLRSPRPR